MTGPADSVWVEVCVPGRLDCGELVTRRREDETQIAQMNGDSKVSLGDDRYMCCALKRFGMNVGVGPRTTNGDLEPFATT
jgi:hypothetical protein